MNEEELGNLEARLGITLPAEYRDLVCDYRFEREQVFLWNNAERLVRTNLSFRDGAFGEAEWPNHRYTFGHDGAGNHFFIDTSDASLRVYCIDHETHVVSFESDNLEDWLDSEFG